MRTWHLSERLWRNHMHGLPRRLLLSRGRGSCTPVPCWRVQQPDGAAEQRRVQPLPRRRLLLCRLHRGNQLQQGHPTPQQSAASCAPHARRASTRANRARPHATSAATASLAPRAPWCRSRRRARQARTSTRRPMRAWAARRAACARAAHRPRGRAREAATAWRACRSRPTAPRGATAA